LINKVALYSLNIKPVRKAGTALARSAHHGGGAVTHGALGKSAYLSGEKFIALDGVVTDYRNKHEVEYSHPLILPGGGTCDKESFWRAVDTHKTQKDTATIARDLIVAFPHELTFDERKSCGITLATWIAERYTVAVDMGMHAPETDKGASSKNFHGHLLISERQVDEHGKLGKIQRELNHLVCQKIDDKRGRTSPRETAAFEIRKAWERIANEHLERGGHKDRIDCRSYKEQGIDKTPGTHRGAAATREMRNNQNAERFAYKRVTVNQVRSDLAKRAQEVCAKRADALQSIVTIQESRTHERGVPQIVANIGTVEEWQRDAAKMFLRYWRNEDRAMEMRRRLRAVSRAQKLMRDATKEEEKQLRTFGRTLARSDKTVKGLSEIIDKLNTLPGNTVLDVDSKSGPKEILAELDRLRNKTNAKIQPTRSRMGRMHPDKQYHSS